MEDFVTTAYNMILQDLKNVSSNTFAGVQVSEENNQPQPLPSELENIQLEQSPNPNENVNLNLGLGSVYN